jgi:conjugal transfer/entry exclusion protein
MPATKRLQVRVSANVAEQVDALASKLGVSQSAVGSMLMVAGLGRLGDVLNDPNFIATAVAAGWQEMKSED